MATVDVTVRGGGVFGLSVAWECARRGARVRLIETTRIGAGASGGVVGALAPHVPEQWNAKKQFQFESLVMAGDFWGGVTEAGGAQTGFARVGRLQPLADAAAAALAEGRVAGAAEHWQGQGIWRVAPVAGFGVLAPVSPTGLVVHDTLSARANPRLLGPALVAAIRAKGGEIVIGEGPDEGAVVWATGIDGLGALSAAFGKQVGNGVKGQAAILGFDAGTVPQVFADGLLIVPHANGTVAVGSTAEKRYDAPDTTDEQLDAVLARARALCPDLADAPVLERWAGVRPRAATMAPVLGAWPGRTGHYVANGGFKIGFGMAPKVAQVMADLLLEGRDAIPAGFKVEDCL